MNTQRFRLRAAVLLAAAIFPAKPVPAAPDPVFSWDLIWAGAWEEKGNLTNRTDLKLNFAGSGLTLRGEFLDRRPGDFKSLIRPWEVEGALTNFLGGVYHSPTGSRILYGPLEEWGMAARLRSPWSKGLPFAESRKSSLAELRTAPSTKEPELYVYLGTPFFGLPGKFSGTQLRGFTSIRMNPAGLTPEPGDSGTAAFLRPPLGEGPALTAALEGRFGKTATLSLEGFYTAASIPARESSGWFAEKIPLPSGNFSLYGLGVLMTMPYFSLSGDMAWSQTSILGRDVYASLGLRAGNRRAGSSSRSDGDWQLSLAADGAGQNYTGSDGKNPGAGFRAGGKFEWRHSRAGLFRINSTVSGPGFILNGGKPDLSFDRSSSGFYYRPPAAALPLRVSRLSLSADRDVRDSSPRDSAGLSVGLALNPRGIVEAIAGIGKKKSPGEENPAEAKGAGPVNNTQKKSGVRTGGALALNFSGSLTGAPAGNWGPDAEDLSPWPIPQGPYRLDSFKTGGEIGWSAPVNLPAGGLTGWFTGSRRGGRGSLQIKAGLDYAVSAPGSEEDQPKESRGFDLQAALQGNRGRIRIKLTYPGFPWKPQKDSSSDAAWKLNLSWKMEL
ncbi:MAG: hypothetical protein LBI94_09370 [Treponema sp.]|jgi:hypothetical protein|nr:hypothetical protein [Treponema sp.]